MLLQKRIQKNKAQSFVPKLKVDKRKKKESWKLQEYITQGPRCDYQLIPNPSKYLAPLCVHVLYGDIVITRQDDSFITDLSYLNNFKRYQEIKVIKIGKEKVLSIQPESLDIETSTDWKILVKDLEVSGVKRLEEWGQIIKNYSQSFELLRDEQNNNRKLKNSKTREKELKTTELSEQKINRLFADYPCICLKRCLWERSFYLTKILFAEKYLKLLGYTNDTFAAITLKEGIPLTEKNMAPNNEMAFMLIKNLFDQDNSEDSQPFEFRSFVILKCGYIRKLTYQIHHLPTYESGRFGVNTVIAVISKGTPEFDPEQSLNYHIESDFFQEAIHKDEEAAKFNEVYYNKVTSQRYKYFDKVCKIKALPIRQSEGEYYLDIMGTVAKEECESFCKEETVGKVDDSN